MTPRERILSVYAGRTPDTVPFMLDLSHWFYERNRQPWDLSVSYDKPERELLEYHKQAGVGFYIPNLSGLFETSYSDDVKATVRKSDDGGTIIWSFETPLGSIERRRVWEECSYSWGIPDWGVATEEQLKILGYALGHRTFRFLPKKFQDWVDCIGDQGVCYVGSGYSAMGQLLGYWMGIEGTMYATVDWPNTLTAVVEQINQCNLALIDVLAAAPVRIVCMGDNFSSNVQPPHFFARWSRSFYSEAMRRLHAAGKQVAVHVDGHLAGAITMLREAGADCIDAVTPLPMGDLTSQQCRDEAGPALILSGGVSPDLWLPTTPLSAFTSQVLAWLELRRQSPRLIANAGDQVPPGADEDRIKIMRDLVELHGRY